MSVVGKVAGRGPEPVGKAAAVDDGVRYDPIGVQCRDRREALSRRGRQGHGWQPALRLTEPPDDVDGYLGAAVQGRQGTTERPLDPLIMTADALPDDRVLEPEHVRVPGVRLDHDRAGGRSLTVVPGVGKLAAEQGGDLGAHGPRRRGCHMGQRAEPQVGFDPGVQRRQQAPAKSAEQSGFDDRRNAGQPRELDHLRSAGRDLGQELGVCGPDQVRPRPTSARSSQVTVCIRPETPRVRRCGTTAVASASEMIIVRASSRQRAAAPGGPGGGPRCTEGRDDHDRALGSERRQVVAVLDPQHGGRRRSGDLLRSLDEVADIVQVGQHLRSDVGDDRHPAVDGLLDQPGS